MTKIIGLVQKTRVSSGCSPTQCFDCQTMPHPMRIENRQMNISKGLNCFIHVMRLVSKPLCIFISTGLILGCVNIPERVSNDSSMTLCERVYFSNRSGYKSEEWMKESRAELVKRQFNCEPYLRDISNTRAVREASNANAFGAILGTTLQLQQQQFLNTPPTNSTPLVTCTTYKNPYGDRTVCR